MLASDRYSLKLLVLMPPAGSFIVLSVIFMVFTKRAATGQWIGGKI